MVAKDCAKKGSPKAVVGEIDTSAPFQSVKEAVNLFGEGAFSGEKPAVQKAKIRSDVTMGVLAKEYKLQLVQKELNKLKDRLKNAEISKVHALSDLAKAKQTFDDLTSKLNIVSESKESAIKKSEEAKKQVKRIQETNSFDFNGLDGFPNQILDTSREEYISALAELEAAKQELRKTRRDCEAYGEAKAAALQRAADSKVAAQLNLEKAAEVSKQISTVNESIEQLKFASCLHTGGKESNRNDEMDLEKESYRARVQESAKKLIALNEEVNSKLMQNLESELNETESQADQIQKKMDDIRVSDLDSLVAVTSKLDNAKESLHKVSHEKITLRQLVETLKIDLKNVKKELSEVKVKEAEVEYVSGNLHVKLRISKAELEAAIAEESKLGAASGEILSALQRLSVESESCRCEAEKMKHQAEELKMEAEATRTLQEEVENELTVTLQAAEEAKAAESRALEQVKILSERASATRASTSDSGTQITISKEEFESLSRKAEQSNKLAEMKVAAAMAQVEAVKASEDEAIKKLEATLKEIDDMKAATVETLKRAEMAEAAKKAVEGELRRWREREQKMAAEVMSRILAENDVSFPSCPIMPQIQKQNPLVNTTKVRKLERAKTSASRKVIKPSISGMFSRKKSQVEGAYPSYLPGEQHM